jgi:hypothetical protein
MTKDELEAIMEGEYTNDNGLADTITSLHHFAEVTLQMNPEGGSDLPYVYKVSIKDLLSNDIDEETLVKAKANGWNLSKDKNFLCKVF